MAGDNSCNTASYAAVLTHLERLVQSGGRFSEASPAPERLHPSEESASG